MLCVRGITHDRTTIQSFPSRSREMDSHEIPLRPVAGKKIRMRHRCRGGGNWTGIPLNACAVCSQEQDISRRYVQDVGDILAVSNRLIGVLTYSIAQVGFLLGGSTYLQGCASSSNPHGERTRRGLKEPSARYVHIVLVTDFPLLCPDEVPLDAALLDEVVQIKCW